MDGILGERGLIENAVFMLTMIEVLMEKKRASLLAYK